MARRKSKTAKRKEPELSKKPGKSKVARTGEKAKPQTLKANKSSAGRKSKSRFSRTRRIMRRAFRMFLILAVALALLTILITLLYKPAAVHPVSTLMLWNKIRGETVTRSWVAFDDISPNVWQSVVSSEDGQFCSHGGVDWPALNQIIDDAIEGEPVRGASTIPMQSVKNLYLWSSRSYVRKGLEIPLALLVDAVWGKKRLMEIYLNIAEWGPGIYGIEAAAQHHFGRSAKRLSRRQAALLAVTLPNPILRNPKKPGKGMRRLARLVERRARASGAYVKCLR